MSDSSQVAMSHEYSILLLNGPNLNLLGGRETSIYGKQSYESLMLDLQFKAKNLGVLLHCEQSNHEGVMIDLIQQAQHDTQGIIINPGAYGHTSIALRDACLSINLPFIEVHISNIMKRESFRHHSYLSDIAQGCLYGFGIYGYEMALNAMMHLLKYSHTKQ
jgi:3-dehydroquinate dehydratase II